MLHGHRTALLRVLALLAALSILPFAAASADAGATYLSNCTVNLRSRPSTSATIKKAIPVDTAVWVSGSVTGGSWKADCGKSVSGTTWLKITSIGGHSVSSLLGVSVVYAAKGLFRLAGVSYGVDISHWQGWIDFAKVKAAGKRFVIAKASEGNTSTDSYYASNKKYAMANGLKFTGYHFARPNGGTSDAVAEADHFVNVLGLRHGMLIPVLDLEVSGGLGTSALQSWVKAFLSRVHDRLGVRAMIYTNASFWKTSMGNTSWFAANGYKVLWIANWGVTSPSVPGTNWGGRGWTFWQYSDCGKVSGISGCVDLDKYKSTDFSPVTY
jgi:GH25 family lysozyme M1 (1,4-beta-N-acetylmuramidase)